MIKNIEKLTNEDDDLFAKEGKVAYAFFMPEVCSVFEEELDAFLNNHGIVADMIVKTEDI